MTKTLSLRSLLPLWFPLTVIAITVAALVQFYTMRPGQADEAPTAGFTECVDVKGNISLPDDFETRYVHLGTVAVASKPGEPVKELHGTYTRKEDLEAFQRDGRFPDGAVLVKDVRAVTGEKLTTGTASYSAAVKIWFVMVKDSQGRFPGNDLWGDGWGWGLFEGKDRKKQVAVNYATECRSCHVPVRDSDWIYTKCYPALDAAAKKVSSVEPVEKHPEARPNLVTMFPQWEQAKTLKGDAAAGKSYYSEKTVGNTMTCAACHSFDPRDSMQVDGDGLVRTGFPIFASSRRTDIKHSGTNEAALGGNVCVLHFMGGEAPGMDAQELSNLSAFLATGGGPDHPTAKNIDYAHTKWTIPEDLSGGDAVSGERLAKQTCITCHDIGNDKAKLVNSGIPLTGDSYAVGDLKELVLQIRNPDYKHNDVMPGYTDLRLTNEQLLDLVAWFTAKK